MVASWKSIGKQYKGKGGVSGRELRQKAEVCDSQGKDSERHSRGGSTEAR